MAESDDREFDAVLAGYSDVRATYRAESVGEQPSERLDAAILAASRRAVNARPAGGHRPWSFVNRMAVPLSVAAVMVLATSLSFLVYEERGMPSAPASTRGVRAPDSDGATPRGADRSIDMPAAAAGESSPRESKSGLRETTPSDAAPEAANAESPRAAPGAPMAAAPTLAPSPEARSAPAAVTRSEGVAEAPQPRVPMQNARQEQDAAAAMTSGVKVASERSMARKDSQDSMQQAEAARAATDDRGVDRAAAARQAASGAADEVARVGDLDAPKPAASTAHESAVSAVTKRLAASARARAMDSTSGEGAYPNAAAPLEEAPAAWIARVRALVDAGRIDAARAEAARLRCRYPDIHLPPDLPAPGAGVDCPAAAAQEGSPDLR